MVIICDTSPIINLAVISLLNLLPEVFGNIVIPKAVFEEITIKGKGGPGSKEIQTSDWVSVKDCKNREQVEELKEYLDAGEAEAISLALELKADILLIDEKEGRKIAKRYALPVTGVLGMLVQGKKMNKISSVKKVMDDLVNVAKFRIDEKTYQLILKLAEES